MSKALPVILMMIGFSTTETVYAQQSAPAYTWEASIPEVTSAGYYRIAVTPAIAAQLSNNTPNFRIYQSGKEVPYLFQADTTGREYAPVPDPHVSKRPEDSKQATSLQLEFERPYLISKFTFDIISPALYHRKAILFEDTELHVKEKVVRQLAELENFEIISGKPLQVVVTRPANQQYFALNIQNEDNPPLDIGTIHAWQKKMWLVAYLEKDAVAVIKGREVYLPAPVYDLTYFKDSLRVENSMLQPGSIVNIKATAVTDVSPTFTLFGSKWWVWLGIVIMAGLLVFIAVRMLREMKTK